jgi:hypothetical protein
MLDNILASFAALFQASALNELPSLLIQENWIFAVEIGTDLSTGHIGDRTQSQI